MFTINLPTIYAHRIKRDRAKAAIVDVLTGFATTDGWNGERPWFVRGCYVDHGNHRAWGIRANDLHDVLTMDHHDVRSVGIRETLADDPTGLALYSFRSPALPEVTMPCPRGTGRRVPMFARVPMPALGVSAGVVRAATKELLAEGVLIDASPYRTKGKLYRLTDDADSLADAKAEEEVDRAAVVVKALGFVSADHSPASSYAPSRVTVSVVELENLLARLDKERGK